MKPVALFLSSLALAALALAATPPPAGYEGVYEAAVGNWLGGESTASACSRSFEVGAAATPVNDSITTGVVTVELTSISTIQRQVQSGDSYVVSPNDWKENGQACRSDGYLAASAATTEEIYNLLRVYLTTAELEGITEVAGVICALYLNLPRLLHQIIPSLLTLSYC